MLRQRRSRLVLITLTLVLLLFNLVSIAAANPPTKEPLPAAPLTVTGKCDFDVLLEPLTNKEVITTFFDKEGNTRLFLITGAFRERLTNLSTGKSVDLNIPGPIQLIPQPDGSQIVITLEGNQLIGQMTTRGPIPLFAESETHFFSKVVDAQLDFTKDEKGVVSGAVLHLNGRDQKAVRTKN